ncbi:hypothetical protein [Pantoea cypripedii]|uniref:Uncharacterized protein n=1 Tax=Pantoea cypripedii TaxID=55209 RepID=A0A1X1EKR0_PANCY|nr:hypothetical protein [Pantoea cypripedii]MBP2198997.1 hypothetical protein [Pantoea cypripedii]ORM89423.1 hypothetical protein HA50_22560 [Pantoea cypripedii]
MQPAMTDAVKLILQYGSPAILAVVIVMMCSVIYVWLIKADPVRAMRGRVLRSYGSWIISLMRPSRLQSWNSDNEASTS